MKAGASDVRSNNSGASPVPKVRRPVPPCHCGARAWRRIRRSNGFRPARRPVSQQAVNHRETFRLNFLQFIARYRVRPTQSFAPRAKSDGALPCTAASIQLPL